MEQNKSLMRDLDWARRRAQREADAAFDTAIGSGRLSADYNAENYAGLYMFMGTDSQGNAAFKHRLTREYIGLASY